MNPFTAFFAKFFLGHMDYYCIVNLIAGKQAVPEFMQSEACAQPLASELQKILEVHDYREQMLRSLKRVTEELGHGGATGNLVSYLQQKYG